MTDPLHNNARRWYDSAKVIWGLFILVVGLLGAITGALWAQATRNTETNAVQDAKIHGIETFVNVKVDHLEQSVEDVKTEQRTADGKLDAILERLPR